MSKIETIAVNKKSEVKQKLLKSEDGYHWKDLISFDDDLSLWKLIDKGWKIVKISDTIGGAGSQSTREIKESIIILLEKN